MSKNTDTFDSICGDCAGIDLADFSSYLLDEPAGEYGQYPYGLCYEAGDDTGRNNEVEIKADKLGVEIEWAGNPDEDEDGNGYWPFRVA